MSYKVSDTIMTLNDLGIFSLLKQEKYTANELSTKLMINIDPLEVLLELLVTVSVLEKENKLYCLPKNFHGVLPMIEMERQQRAWHYNNNSLHKILTTENRFDCMDDLSNNKEIFQNYFKSMEASTRAIALNIVRLSKLSNGIKIMDIGGGDGSLSMSISNYINNCEYLVIDRDASKELFNRRIKLDNSNIKMRFLPDDLIEPQHLFSTINDYDTIILSNILHLLPSIAIENILTKILKNSSSNTKIIIYDQFIDKSNELTASDFMVVDWLLCKSKFNYTVDEFADQLKSYGYNNVKTYKPNTLSGKLIVAEL